MLLRQRRFELAEDEFRRLLAADPDDGMIHAWLAICLTERRQLREALEAARNAVHLEPDGDLSYYALAYVHEEMDQPREARAAIEQALALDPYDPDYWGFLARLDVPESRWTAVLEAAERGLECSPDHHLCNNLRALALTKLGRRDEAGDNFGEMLRQDPESSVTHANVGWAALHHNDPQTATRHFQEAMRLDPTNEWAREGIVSALKARNPVYRGMLRYFMWISGYGRRSQWTIIACLFGGYLVLSRLAEAYPGIGPFIEPLLYCYFAFAVATWLADPFFNLILFLSREGRFALSDRQRVGALCLGVVLLVTIPCFAAWLWWREDFLLSATFCGLFLTLCIAAVQGCRNDSRRQFFLVFSLIIAAAIAVFIGLAAVGSSWAETVFWFLLHIVIAFEITYVFART